MSLVYSGGREFHIDLAKGEWAATPFCREMGLSDVAVYDTELAVKTAVAGMDELIKGDKKKK